LSVAFPASVPKSAPGKDQEVSAAIRKDVEAAYAPLAAVLKFGKAFADRLSGDLKGASTEKDRARRKAALDAFSAKYAADYGKFAAKSGLRKDQLFSSLGGLPSPAY